MFFLLYNGGYRASPFPGSPALIFHPDQTELMLLHPISLLQERVTELHGPGIDFAIVINNGVASWANDIPVAETEAYVARLREMMRAVGADRGVRLLVQSELAGFREGLGGVRCPPASSVSRKEHAVVERFLGRQCYEHEARRRIALYALAEAAWAERLRPIAASEGAILLRQVAHPAMLSFRPFPGGAIRAQNGSLGFFAHEHALLPKLITTETFARHAIELADITRASMTGRGSGISPEPVDA